MRRQWEGPHFSLTASLWGWQHPPWPRGRGLSAFTHMSGVTRSGEYCLGLGLERWFLKPWGRSHRGIITAWLHLGTYLDHSWIRGGATPVPAAGAQVLWNGPLDLLPVKSHGCVQRQLPCAVGVAWHQENVLCFPFLDVLVIPCNSCCHCWGCWELFELDDLIVIMMSIRENRFLVIHLILPSLWNSFHQFIFKQR